MGIFDFKPKFKESGRSFPEFTTKEALPENDDIKYYYYHYVLKGSSIGPEQKQEREKIQLAIAEKIRELLEAKKIDGQQDYVMMARRRFFPTEDDKVLTEQKQTEKIAEEFQEKLRAFEEKIKSSTPRRKTNTAPDEAYWALKQLLEGRHDSYHYEADYIEASAAYARANLDDIIQTALRGTESDKTGQNRYYISYYVLKDLVYLKDQGLGQPGADYAAIVKKAFREEVMYGIYLNRSTADFNRIFNSRLDEAKYFVKEVTPENYRELLQEAIARGQKMAEDLQQSIKDLEQGRELCMTYCTEEELEQGLALVQKSVDFGNKEAFRWMIQYQADTGDGHSQYLLSRYSVNGKHGFRKDSAVAREWLIRAARNNDPDEVSQLAYEYLNGDQPQSAMNMFRRIAKDGDTRGYMGMAESYFAMKQYELAAELYGKVRECQFNGKSAVDILQAMSRQVELNQLEKIKLPGENALAVFALARKFIELAMIEKPENPLYVAYQRAKDNPGIRNLEKLWSAIQPENLKYPVGRDFLYSVRQAVECVEILLWHEEAEQGNTAAYMKLFRFYRSINPFKAEHWGCKALDVNDPGALYAAAHDPEAFGLDLSMEEAYDYIKLAARLGNPSAQNELYVKKDEMRKDIAAYKRTLENDSLSSREKEARLEQIEKDMSYTIFGESMTLEKAHNEGMISYSGYVSIKDIKDAFLKE